MWKLFKCLPVFSFLSFAGCGPTAEGANVADNPYPITVQLDVAQVDQRFPTPGMRYLYADLSSTGQAKIKFGSPSNQALTLIPGSNYPIVADDIFLTYEAQAGKKLELLHSAFPIGGGGNRQLIDPTLPKTVFTDTAVGPASVNTTLVGAAENVKGIKILGGELSTFMTSAGKATCGVFVGAIGHIAGMNVAGDGVNILIDSKTIAQLYIPPGEPLGWFAIVPNVGDRCAVILNYEILQ